VWIRLTNLISSGTLESLGELLAAVVDEDAELNVGAQLHDAQHVGPQRRAQAHGRVQVGKPAQELAARLRGRRRRALLLAELQAHQPAKNARARAQLQRVHWAPRPAAAPRFRGRRGARRRRRRLRARR